MQRTWTGLKPSATARVSVSLPFQLSTLFSLVLLPVVCFPKVLTKTEVLQIGIFLKKVYFLL